MKLSRLYTNRPSHFEIAFEKARAMLDGLLYWRALSQWDFRHGLGYLRRSLEDCGDVFRLAKHEGQHSTWKPFLAHVLGFNADLVSSHYEKEAEKSQKENTEQIVINELGGSAQDISKIEGILLLKQQEVEKKQSLIDTFDFRKQDKDQTKALVGEVDGKIAELNSLRYSLGLKKKKILASLEDDQILFNPDEARQLFAQAGVLFEGQIKKDFEQLIAFNRAITDERRVYLDAERLEIEADLKRVSTELDILGKKRSAMLACLSDTDVFNKYKHASDEIVALRADIISLERQRGQWTAD